MFTHVAHLLRNVVSAPECSAEVVMLMALRFRKEQAFILSLIFPFCFLLSAKVLVLLSIHLHSLRGCSALGEKKWHQTKQSPFPTVLTF